MSLIKYRPTGETRRAVPALFGAWDPMDPWFENMIATFWKDAPRTLAADLGQFNPPVDIAEDGSDVVLRAELPGVKKEDVEITVHENTLTLKGSKKMELSGNVNGNGEGEKPHRYIERRYGEFMRTFTLPNTVDAEKVSADFKDGILEIRMPILEAAKPRKVAISAN